VAGQAAIFLHGRSHATKWVEPLSADDLDAPAIHVDQERTTAKHGRIAGPQARAPLLLRRHRGTIVRYHERTAAISAATTSPTSQSLTRRRPAALARTSEVFTCGTWCQGAVMAAGAEHGRGPRGA